MDIWGGERKYNIIVCVHGRLSRLDKCSMKAGHWEWYSHRSGFFFFFLILQVLVGLEVIKSGKNMKVEWAGNVAVGVCRLWSLKWRIWRDYNYRSWQDCGCEQRRWNSRHHFQRNHKRNEVQLSRNRQHGAQNHEEFYLFLWHRRWSSRHRALHRLLEIVS